MVLLFTNAVHAANRSEIVHDGGGGTKLSGLGNGLMNNICYGRGRGKLP